MFTVGGNRQPVSTCNEEGDVASQPDGAEGVLPDALARAALELLAEVGLEAMTVDDVATRAGIPPAVVQLRWSSVTTLVALALRTCALVPPVQGSGSLRRDLVFLMEPWTRRLSRCELAAAALLVPARHRYQIRAVLEEGVVGPLAAAVAAITSQQGDRSNSPPHPTTNRLLCVVVQALWWERYTGRLELLSDDGVGRLVDDVLLPIVEAR